MITRRTLMCMLGAAAVATWVGPARAAAPTPGPDSPDFPVYAMNRLDDLFRGSASHAVLRMHVKTQHFTRTMTMESWSKGKERSLIRILSPKKERGTATLMTNNDLFTYLNKTGRTVKITGGMLGASWMGSHLTNDDLVRRTRLSEDYEIEKTFSGVVAGVAIHVFTMTPKPDAAVVWGKVEVALRQDDLLPLRQVFYDEDGKRVREQLYSDHRTFSGRRVPTKLVIRPLDGSGEYTEVSYETLELDVELRDDFFTLQRLKAM
jgi:hypothetical protein